MAILRYPDNSYAQITSSVVHHREKQEIILQGSEANITFPWKVMTFKSEPNGFPIPNNEKN